MKKTPILFAAFLTMAVPHAIHAQGADALEISGNVAIANDYSFRGWSQTTRDPAIQGGFDIELEGGFSVGTWMSNVNFGDSTSTELDLYAGFSASLSDAVSWSISVIRFEYPSEGDALDYMELAASLAFGSVTVGINVSPEYLGSGGPSFTYPYADYSLSLSDDIALDLHVGLSSVDEDNFFAIGEDSYVDYSATITTPFAGLDVSIGVVGTSLEDNPDTEGRLVLTLSKSL